MMTRVKTPAEQSAMRESGRMLATVLDIVAKQIKPGLSTAELDSMAAAEVKKLGGKPAFLDYGGFPAVMCVSVNDEVVHGLPGKLVIAEGDIVSIDFGVKYRGMITDAARSLLIGKASNAKTKQQLIDGTLQSLDAGIAVVKGGIRVGDISAAIQAVIESYGYGIVRDLVGHGVGHSLHEEPNIPNYGLVGSGELLQAGMTIAIEPMTTLGSHAVYTAPDGWTILTRDGSLAAHFEDTVLITETGAEVLTRL